MFFTAMSDFIIINEVDSYTDYAAPLHELSGEYSTLMNKETVPPVLLETRVTVCHKEGGYYLVLLVGDANDSCNILEDGDTESFPDELQEVDRETWEKSVSQARAFAERLLSE